MTKPDMRAPYCTLLLPLLLAACLPGAGPVPALSEDPMPTEGTSAGAEIHLVTIERAYTLDNPRDFEFRQQVASEASALCGRAGHTIQSTRPIGQERIGEDFLYRMVEVGFACKA